ncbi:DUF2066 domain-containing protein [Thiomicrospira sp.]|uniref:DUF2066 domain-containing protein n=1 Tax=Thiomicrospira sp. TaxID=935 RepID=UPI002F95040B
MRTFLIPIILSIFFATQSVQAQSDLNLFVVEKPVEKYHSSQLNDLLTSSMRDLLVRVVGGEAALNHAKADTYIEKARQWVKSYQVENREVDGVVVGQKLVVQFDQNRLLRDFQRDAIQIWPLSERPKTLLIGQWEQQGLQVNLSDESLQYRVDLDYRDYANLLALFMTEPEKQAEFKNINPERLVARDQLNNELLAMASSAGADYVLVFKADVIGEVSSLVWSLYERETGERVLQSDETGESFLSLLQGAFDSLLELYSRPYREGADSYGLMGLTIEAVPSYDALIEMEKFLKQLRPALNEVNLVEVDGEQVRFDIFYQGRYSNVVKLMEEVPNLRLIEESIFSSELRGQFEP